MTGSKVTQIGNSLGVVLPREILAQLGVEKGDTLFFTKAPDGSMRVSPYSEDVARQMEAVQEVMRDYRETLRALAK